MLRQLYAVAFSVCSNPQYTVGQSKFLLADSLELALYVPSLKVIPYGN